MRLLPGASGGRPNLGKQLRRGCLPGLPPTGRNRSGLAEGLGYRPSVHSAGPEPLQLEKNREVLPMNLFEFFLGSLCTYRISLLFSKESGPARIFAKLRKAPPKKSATKEWLSCIFCFSMTASLLVCGL